MNEARIHQLLQLGEGLQVEFKTCSNALNRDVYESVCAFLNRSGGDLLLGVTDDGRITGVDVAAVEQLKKNFVSTLNSPQKINPPFYLDVEEVIVEGKTPVVASEKTSEKTSEKIIAEMRKKPEVTIAELSTLVGVTGRSIERNIQTLQNNGRVRRVGPDKGGHWEVLS